MKTQEQISYNMSKVKSSGSKIEQILGKALWSRGYRYRKQYKKIPGKPDFALVSKKTAIFCDSAFWHGYKNMKTKIHDFKSNQSFWIPKIARNIERDKEVNKLLKELGWTVIRFWDFEIEKDINKCVQKLERKIR